MINTPTIADASGATKPEMLGRSRLVLAVIGALATIALYWDVCVWLVGSCMAIKTIHTDSLFLWYLFIFFGPNITGAGKLRHPGERVLTGRLPSVW